MCIQSARTSNLDHNRRSIIRKGCTVARAYVAPGGAEDAVPGNFRGYVSKVRTGTAYVDWAGGRKADPYPCAWLLVVLPPL